MNEEYTTQQRKISKRKGGRPKKATSQIRTFKHTLFLSESEEKLLYQMQKKTGQSPADLFRHGLLGKGLRIPKARIAPAELIELLTDFKKKSGLIQLLAHRERDFNAQEKELLIGSSDSMKTAIERLERSVFVSLYKADKLEQLKNLLIHIEQVKNELRVKNKLIESDYKKIEELLKTAHQILQQHYQYLTLI